jgi:hypothetical protein
VQSKRNGCFCCSWQMLCLDCQLFLLVLRMCLISYVDIINIKIFHFLYLLHRQQYMIFVVCISNMVRHCVSCPYPINGEISNFLHLSCDRCVGLIVISQVSVHTLLWIVASTLTTTHLSAHSFHIKRLLFLSSFNKNWNGLTYFVKSHRKFRKRHLMGVALFCALGHMDMKRLQVDIQFAHSRCSWLLWVICYSHLMKTNILEPDTPTKSRVNHEWL